MFQENSPLDSEIFWYTYHFIYVIMSWQKDQRQFYLWNAKMRKQTISVLTKMTSKK